jgi:hypothetical protein
MAPQVVIADRQLLARRVWVPAEWELVHPVDGAVELDQGTILVLRDVVLKVVEPMVISQAPIQT